MHKTFLTLTIVALTIGVTLWRWSPQQAANYVCTSATEFRNSTSNSNALDTNTWVETTTKTLQWRLSYKVAESVYVLNSVPEGQQYAMLQGLIQIDTKDPTWTCDEAKLLLQQNPVTSPVQNETPKAP